jgi:hypothetical protein
MELDKALQNIYPDIEFDPFGDVILQDDGDGPYIARWNRPEPQPTEAELEQAWTDYQAGALDRAKVATKDQIDLAVDAFCQSFLSKGTLMPERYKQKQEIIEPWAAATQQERETDSRFNLVWRELAATQAAGITTYEIAGQQYPVTTADEVVATWGVNKVLWLETVVPESEYIRVYCASLVRLAASEADCEAAYQTCLTMLDGLGQQLGV